MEDRALRRLFGPGAVSGAMLGAVLGVGALLAQAALAQQILRVSVKNMSFGAVYLTVHDDVCQRVVFQRRLANAATTTLRVCADRRGKAQISVYDYRGRRQAFRDLTSGRSVTVRVR